jgi:hypothetical protein
MKTALLLFLLAGPASAQVAPYGGVGMPVGGGVAIVGASDVFTERFIGSVALSMAEQPFFASRLLNSFETHVARFATATSGAQAAAYLRGEILKDAEPQGLLERLADSWVGPPAAAEQGRRVREGLGTRPISENQAGALMLANAVTAPEQFHGIVKKLETSRPGMGSHFKRILSEAGGTPGASVRASNYLRSVGNSLRPVSAAFTYDSKGRLDTLFDGSR